MLTMLPSRFQASNNDDDGAMASRYNWATNSAVINWLRRVSYEISLFQVDGGPITIGDGLPPAIEIYPGRFKRTPPSRHSRGAKTPAPCVVTYGRATPCNNVHPIRIHISRCRSRSRGFNDREESRASHSIARKLPATTSPASKNMIMYITTFII